MPHGVTVKSDDLTTSHAARLLDCAEGTVRNLARRGELPALRLASGMRLFRKADVERLRVKRAQRQTAPR